MFIESIEDHIDVLKDITFDTKIDSSHLSAIDSLIEAIYEFKFVGLWSKE